jgi:hypothetical protein
MRFRLRPTGFGGQVGEAGFPFTPEALGLAFSVRAVSNLL